MPTHRRRCYRQIPAVSTRHAPPLPPGATIPHLPSQVRGDENLPHRRCCQ
jgi:hypothetical protein